MTKAGAAVDKRGQVFGRAAEIAAKAWSQHIPVSAASDLSGKQLSHYRVKEKIGAGGMGVIFRACDERLRRDVAIKVLPGAFADDPERLARLDREARLLASISHPNVAAIHGLELVEEKRFLVLELVEGETLAQKIAAGPLPLDEAVVICRQIADGLEAAHEKGVIHRDLKPANIKITPEGNAKILDFGLAKALTEGAPSGDQTNPPTITATHSHPGVILGTAAYMSPEQAKGKPVDKRADIWAFGCILYECLTGKRPFQGDTITQVLASVLQEEPDWKSLPEGIPRNVTVLLRRCLQKDPRIRLRDIGDARIEIGEAVIEPSPATAVARSVLQRWILSIGTASLLLGVFGGEIVMRHFRPTFSQPVVRASVRLEPGFMLDGLRRWGDEVYGIDHPTRTAMTLSSDSRFIVYSAIRENQGAQDKSQLYLRKLDQVEAKPIAGTEGGISPFLSPDDRWVGFWAEGMLKKIPINGGVPADLVPVTLPIGVSWGANDQIVFASWGYPGIAGISSVGGEPRKLTTPDISKGEMHRLPHWLPGGKALLFTIAKDSWDMNPRISVLEVASAKWHDLLENAADARYVSTGHLAFMRQGTLMVVPFDSEKLRVTGPPVPSISGISQALNTGISMLYTGAGQFSISKSGSLVYAPGGVPEDPQRSLLWVDHEGRTAPIGDLKGPIISPRLSPDGQQIAYWTLAKEWAGYIYDLKRGTNTKITSEGKANYLIWTPDGSRVVLGWWKTGRSNLYWKSPYGNSPLEQLTDSECFQAPGSFSRDGQTLAFLEQRPDTAFDIMLLRMRDRRIIPLVNSRLNEMYPDFSPDGRWLAYVSLAEFTGRREVHVQAFPGPQGNWQISTQGGEQPIWAPNGKRLFYRLRNSVWAVDIETESGFTPGRPRMLFENSELSMLGDPIRGWDISRDGQRFLMVKREERKPQPITEMILVQNWFEELKRLAPTGNK